MVRIWKFGENLDIWKKCGNLKKFGKKIESWKKIEICKRGRNLGRELKIWKRKIQKFGKHWKLGKNWKFGKLENKLIIG